MDKMMNKLMTQIPARNGLAHRLLAAAALAALPAMAQAADPTFIKLNNPGDLNFNQLLGINNGRVIAGYFGDGKVVPNNGYVLVPQNHYAVENFTKVPASQTQAIGINNRELVEIVGFYIPAAATSQQHGFLDRLGIQQTVDDPMGLKGIKTPVQNLLSVNDNNQASGFWTDNAGATHGFVVALRPAPFTFTEVPPSLFGSSAVSDQVTGITDNGQICGFWTDTNGNSHGFFGTLGGKLISFTFGVSTQAFGCNNNGHVVGAFTQKNGSVRGFFTPDRVALTVFDAPGSSQTPAFGVMGTFINGINITDDFVGFYSDGTHVNGFARFATANGPED